MSSPKLDINKWKYAKLISYPILFLFWQNNQAVIRRMPQSISWFQDGILLKPQDDPYRQDPEQPATLVDGCQLVLVEAPRILCLDLAYSKILSTT